MSNPKPVEGARVSATRVIRGRAVTHDEAQSAAQRLVNSYFGNKGGAKASVPVQADDDDVLIMNYIAEQREAALSAAPAPRMFPIQKATPIPWSLAERAYRTYAEHYGRQQSLERLAERGGFGWSEFLHLYYEDTTYAKKEEMQARWDADELAQAKLRIAELEALAAAPARDGVRAYEMATAAEVEVATICGHLESGKYRIEVVKALEKRFAAALAAAKEQADGQGI